MPKKKLKNPDNCQVLLYIVENNLSTPIPEIDPEDLDMLIFMKKIAVDYSTGTLYIPENKELKSFIEEYRQMFNQKNINYPGKMDSAKSHVDKFKKFFKENDTTYDEVLQVTRDYIVENINKPQYIMKSSNFVSKYENKMFKSELQGRLENKKQTTVNNLFLE